VALIDNDVLVYVDGAPVRVAAGASAVAALVLAGQLCTRRSVSGEARFALCGMGQCQECRVTIDGAAHRLACQVRCYAGMSIHTADGALP
jgi:aerobic-type carbon monoxide dehydrogenase small subunit (CoxS/CutS family)